MMRRLTILLTLFLAIGCSKKPPEPKELYDTYRSSVVLIKNSYYFKVSFDNGIDFFYYMNGEEPVIVESEEEAIENASSSYGTGFFISDRGEIATNRHVIFPGTQEEKAGVIINERFTQLRSNIRKEVNNKNLQKSEAADLYNKYYNDLTYSELNQLKNAYAALGDEIIELEDFLNQFDFDPKNTEYETIHLFTGVVFDDTFVNRESDFQECVPIKKALEELADLAIIQLKNKKTPASVKAYLLPDRLETDDKIELDDKVYMIGYNQGIVLANTSNGIKTQFTSGTVTQDPDNDRLLYSIPTLQGSSGSPVIDQWGNLVAVNFAKISAYQGFSFGVPVSKLAGLYNDDLISTNGLVITTDTSGDEDEKKIENPLDGGKHSGTTDVAKAEDYSDQISGLLAAEELRDFEQIYEYYSHNNLIRYWNLNNPTQSDLKEQYEKSWSLSSGAKNKVQSITSMGNNAYDLHTLFTFYHKKKNEWKEVDSKVRFVFDSNGKIKEVYGLDAN